MLARALFWPGVLLLGMSAHVWLAGDTAVIFADDAASPPAKAGDNRLPEHAGDPEAEPLKSLAGLLRKGLPQGWACDVRKNAVIIRRVKPVRAYYLINAPGFGSDAEAAAYKKANSGELDLEITLVAGPRMTLAEYKAATAENERRHLAEEKLYSKVRDIHHKFRSFAPGNDAERKRVREYEEAARAVRPIPLPTYYSPEASFIWDNSAYYYEVLDEQASQERAQIMRRLDLLLGRYEDAR